VRAAFTSPQREKNVQIDVGDLDLRD